MVEIKRFILIFMLGCMALGSHAQQTTNSLAVFKHLNNGNKLLAANDSMAAAKAYIEATKAAPAMAEPYERVGMIYSAIPQHFYQLQAKTNLQKFIELTTDDEKRQAAQKQLQKVEDFLAKENQTDSISEILPDTNALQSTIEKQHIENLNSATVADTTQSILKQLVEEETAEKTTEFAFEGNDDNTANEEVVEDSEEKTEEYNPFLARKRKKKADQNANPVVKKNRNDELQNAYIWHEEGLDTTKPLYAIHHLAETPLANELDIQTKSAIKQEQSQANLSNAEQSKLSKSEKTTQTDGKWASTLRNATTKRELFLMNISFADKKLEILPESGIMLQDKTNDARWVVSNQELTDKSIRCLCECNYQANNIQEVERFVKTQIEPYIGKISEASHNVMTVLKAQAYMPMDIRSSIQLSLKPANYALHGTMDINILIDQDSIQIPVLTQQIPYTMYKADEDYAGFDVSTIELPDFEHNDTIMLIDLLNKEVKDANDLNNLGYCYLNGLGTKQSFSKATTYFEEAAQKGSNEALANLFLIYYNGWGEKARNIEKAFEKLAIGRNAKSATILNISADLLLEAPTPNTTTAFHWFDLAQQQNDAYAIYRLGQMTKDGIGQVQSYPAARGRFEKSRDLGSGDAYYELALMALNGLGCQKKVYDAYRNAINGAQTGSQKAMQMVAEMYFTGIGVRRDFKSGLKWISNMKEAEYNTLIGYKYVEK